MSNSINLSENDKDLSGASGSDTAIDWDYTYIERLVDNFISTICMIVSGFKVDQIYNVVF